MSDNIIRKVEDDEIIINLDVMLAKRKMTLTELAESIGVQMNNLSVFKNGKGAMIKIKTLMRMCKALQCTPNDIFEFREKGAGQTDYRKDWSRV